MNDAIVECQTLSKSYHDGHTCVEVLKSIDFSIQPGAKIAIVGPSGSGKSTLLHLLGGLDTPSHGSVWIKGTDWQAISENKRCRLRNKYLGFIYQFHHLLPEFNALENIAMPLLLADYNRAFAQQKASRMLEQVGLSDRLFHKPSQLSGGERQRVAIARALVGEPACVFADEPTGNLDQNTALKIFDLMLALNTNSQTALVIVTHDMSLAKRMDFVMKLQEGCLTPI